MTKLLDRRWTLLNPNTSIHQIKLSTILPGNGPFGSISFSSNTHPSLGHGIVDNCNPNPSFYVVRDDLLHPLINGNKARKLDGLLPLVEDHSVTDVVRWFFFCSRQLYLEV